MALTKQQIGPCTVTPKGGLYATDEKYELAKLTFIGESPNATVKLYEWTNEIRNQQGEVIGHGPWKFIERDKLTEARITERGANRFEIVGVSAEFAETLPELTIDDYEDEPSLFAKWDILITGDCPDCS